MKINKALTTLSVLLIFVTIVSAKPEDDVYMKINKSFETFGAVFRQVAGYYVVEVDPEDLVNEGINGMLSSLDPYTVYFEENESDDLDFITNGEYTGIGISVGIIDSMLTILDIHQGFAADRGGLKIGDIIFKVDTAVLINKSNDELKKYTKGIPGSKVSISIIRNFGADTINFNISREEIKVKNIYYKGFVSDSIGYIRLDRFTRSSGQDVRDAINELKRVRPLGGLILDLRENPGGLLESAVSICEIFVPQNSPIVTTRGRTKAEERVYKSQLKPTEPDLPLAILINGGSASASEIVAGAIQDLDRGVIVGERSFGKGLVQSVYDLPYNANLKITTAKYYTPSGRCIQRLNYSLKNNHKKGLNIHYDSTYYTLNKRPVIESNGIQPDSVIKSNIMPGFIIDIINKYNIFKFGTYYATNHKTIPDDFKAGKEVVAEFEEWLNNSGYEYKTPLDKGLDSLRTLIKNESFSTATLKELNNLAEKIKQQDVSPIKKNFDILSKYLNIEILKRYQSDDSIYKKSLEDDWYVQGALDLLHPKSYSRILALTTTKKKF